MTHCFRPRTAAVLVLITLGLAGCSLGKTNSETGVRIGDPTLSQFKAGITTEAWLVAILGKPTSWSWVEGVENTKVMRYASGEQSGGIGSILSGKASKNTQVVYFIVTDGLVTRYWADRAIERTLLGAPVPESSGTKQEG